MAKHNIWKNLEQNLPKEDYFLGANFNPSTQEVSFSLWAPSATSVSVLIFSDGKIAEPSFQFQLSKNSESGVWGLTCALDESLDGWFYEFEVTTEKGKRRCLDPYAKSMAAFLNDGTSGRAAIINPENPKYLPQGGWSSTDKSEVCSTLPEFSDYSQAIVYEISVRDATISPDSPEKDEIKKGTYAGFISALPYIKELGITHIQLLPVMNFYNNNETIKTYENSGTTHGNNYNWGYDPHSYFSPEGWYSTEPENPYSRISELKTLINEAHKLGLRVILDVVYNHMAKTDFLDDIVPGYYFRHSKDGSFTSNSGCGNDVATEHSMTRKLIVDSLVYWTKEYHVDGFRFDLMGLLDAQTVMSGYEKCAEIKKDVLFIGEGWKMYNGEKGTVGMDQNYMTKTEKVAVFNDEFRDLAKAGGMSEAGQGFLTGKKVSIPDLFCNCSGKPVHNYSVTKPSSNVQYFACHDGLTLHDSIVNNIPLDESTEEGKIEAVNRLKLANALLLTSQGIAFLHAGQERGRTKTAFTTAGTDDCETIGNFVKNSYDSSDNINNFVWNISDLNKDLLEYTKNLISLRKNNSAFTISTQDEVMSRISLLGEYCDDFFMAYKIADSEGDWYLFFNSNKEDKKIDFPIENHTKLYADKEKVYPFGTECCLQDVVVRGSSVLFLRNVK